jgi:exopolyphosphatase/guanosine-5'-triphosphate,3'-diphosphate pyrophosphatase
VLYHRREITSLGEGLAQTGRLSQEAMGRTLTAVADLVSEMQAFGLARCQGVATQAVRQAANRKEFLQALRQKVPLPVRLLSPAEEAKLTLMGVLSALKPEFLQGHGVLVFDLGGGSSEFVWLPPGETPVFAGLPLGVLTLSQSRPLGDPPRPEAVATLRQEVDKQLQRFFQDNFAACLEGPLHLVGTAGAVTTLAAMSLKMTKYEAARINNQILTHSQVAALAQQLAGLTVAERARLPGLEPGKAQVMVAGALIVLAILKAAHQNLLVVIDSGLLEGLLGVLAA